MKSLFKHVITLATCFTAALFANEPYDSVRQVDYEPVFVQDGYIILDKFNNLGATVFVDVASLGGNVGRYIAANTNESVKVYNINLWDGDQYGFQKFLSNVKQENQNEKIVPIRMSPAEAGSSLNVVSEFIYVDSSNASVLHDNILAWVSHLSENGVIGGNHWERTAVEVAVVTAAAELNLTLSTNGHYWFLNK